MRADDINNSPSAPAPAFRIPDDPLELTVFLDSLRVRILPFVELLEITPDETEMLRRDYAALNYAVRATEEAEILAGEWLAYQTLLLSGEEAFVQPPAPTRVPRANGGVNGGGAMAAASGVRETPHALRYPRVRAGLAARLQAFVDRLIGHPSATDKTRLDLGLLPDATIGFSPGQPPA